MQENYFYLVVTSLIIFICISVTISSPHWGLTVLVAVGKQ